MSANPKKFPPVEITMIFMRDLSPHPAVQRTFDAAHAQRIADGFDPDKFRELYVAKRPGITGKYWVFDGQHRLWAARAWLGSADQKVPCRAWDSIPIERQAELFLDINGCVKQIKALDKWTIRLVAKEEIPLKIEAILHRHKLVVSKTRGDGAVQAVSAVEAVYRRSGGEAILDRTLAMIGNAWGRSPASYDALILRGMAEFLHRFGAKIDERDLWTKLASKLTSERAIGKARAIADSMSISATRGMVQLIVNVYNERRGKGRLEL